MKQRSSLDRLLDGLFRAPHDYRPTTDTFPDLDPKEVAKKLRLEERARELSFRKESLRPPGRLDQIECEIIEYVESDKKPCASVARRSSIRSARSRRAWGRRTS
jgi:hypothetical protein